MRNNALDLFAEAGLASPDAAKYALIKVHTDINLKYPPPSQEDQSNVAVRVFADSTMTGANWQNLGQMSTPLDSYYHERMVCHIDGLAARRLITDGSELHGSSEAQDAGYKMVPLSKDKTIAYTFVPYLYDDPTGEPADYLYNINATIIFEGYYVPLMALLQ